MNWLKIAHVLLVFIWVGNLITLSRLLGYHVKESFEVQRVVAKWYKRMYYFIDLPCMVLAVCIGLFILLTRAKIQHPAPWLHMKLTLSFIIIVCDIYIGVQIAKLAKQPVNSKGVKFKIVHAILGLCLLGILIAIYGMRDKEGEWRLRYEQEIECQQNISNLKPLEKKTP